MLSKKVKVCVVNLRERKLVLLKVNNADLKLSSDWSSLYSRALLCPATGSVEEKTRTIL